MRLVTHRTTAGTTGGVLVGDQVVPLDAAVDRAIPDASPVTTVKAALAAGVVGPALASAARALADAGHGVPVGTLRLSPPVPDPDKILCIGLNYRDHATESALPLPDTPLVFAKFSNSLAGATDDVPYPAVSRKVDYEGELAVVIGRRGSGIREADALAHVAGVMVLNDLSARDLQKATSQWTIGKAVDGFAPCGPALVTLDEAGPLDGLRITTTVNGTVVQDGSTGDMLFDVAFLVSFLSRAMTLEPGDIIATGTPAGVGAHADPPRFLQPGDTVEVAISGLGSLSNTLVEPGDRDGAPLAVAASGSTP